MGYSHILLCADLTDSSRPVGQRAKALAAVFSATITILNVIEYTYINLGGDLALPPQLDIQTQLTANAKQELASYADALSLSDCEQIVEHGVAKILIPEMAEKLQVDLIVLGSHSRHGLARLIGSTANAVLHHANCDILAVRTQSPD